MQSNIILPYEHESTDSDSDDSHENLTNNLGVLYKYSAIQDVKLFDNTNASHHNALRDKYFTPELIKKRILIDTHKITHTTDHDTSNYTISFKNNDNHTNGGFSIYHNVIGFKLRKAIIHNSYYNINNNNNTLENCIYDTTTPFDLILTPGKYTFTGVAEELQSKLHHGTGGDNDISVKGDATTGKYVIKTNSAKTLAFPFLTSQSSMYNLLGFTNSDHGDNNTHTSDHSARQNINYIDLIIPEIPYIACKENMDGKHIIDRIPIVSPHGSLTHYNTMHDHHINYFHPISLDKLTIQLYEHDTNLFYDCQNNDNSFEFEIIMLNPSVHNS